jgi:hypothetical protein
MLPERVKFLIDLLVKLIKLLAESRIGTLPPGFYRKQANESGQEQNRQKI